MVTGLVVEAEALEEQEEMLLVELVAMAALEFLIVFQEQLQTILLVAAAELTMELVVQQVLEEAVLVLGVQAQLELVVQKALVAALADTHPIELVALEPMA
jgi:hypothetical protein